MTFFSTYTPWKCPPPYTHTHTHISFAQEAKGWWRANRKHGRRPCSQTRDGPRTSGGTRRCTRAMVCATRAKPRQVLPKPARNRPASSTKYSSVHRSTFVERCVPRVCVLVRSPALSPPYPCVCIHSCVHTPLLGLEVEPSPTSTSGLVLPLGWLGTPTLPPSGVPLALRDP